MPPAPELKATLTLPQTAFPMKADLPKNEPLRLARWESLCLYNELRKAGQGRPAYLLHDGPPYANGPIHLGHALNKCLKDFVVKSRTMAGFNAPYVPGFDCHGLPIEIKIDERLGRRKLEMPVPAVLDACRAYAQEYVDLQTRQFQRIGCFGRWDAPYKTMDRDYEARTLEAFYGFLEKGFVYRGLKPVYWCIHDRTALAEAEVEYAPHTSPSIYVRYRLTSDPAALDPVLAGRETYTIIWTTTPWTLPASMAVAFHPDFEYVALAASGDPKTPASPSDPVYIVAAELAPAVISACKLGQTIELARFKGSKLEHATFKHPFLERSILGVLGNYVTADTGTGAVHTAPSHGADDFYTGQRYGIDATTRVDAAGHLHVDPQAWPLAALPPFEDKIIWEANPIILAMLEEQRALMASADLEHSYPHCWRCHNPVIFRATEQWFISLETPVKRADGSETTYRQLTIEEIDKVVWDPAWGKERITNMIATRPDWCISRQRIWGVPIAVFMCETCNQPILDPALNRKIVGLFESEGVAAWHTTPVEALLPDNAVCKHCGAVHTHGRGFRKETDILDVWFDSGVSWFAVCEADPDLSTAYTAFQKRERQEVPTCLYLEGGDQHRGWFHSSLLTSVALRGRAPYSLVATAGFTLDEQGRAMSKSLGNGVDPVDIADRLGGEIVRLWVASIDFREDMAASENLMQRCAELYRKVRNTFRFLLGNLSGFNLATDKIEQAELLPLDRYMLARTRDLAEKILAWYAAFEFHRVYQAINEFAIVDLSAFYLDVLKDRMYTFAPTSHARRSAQTVLWQITETLVRLVAPILTFTADEVWDHLPKVEGREASVHLAQFPKPEEIYSGDPVEELLTWQQLLLPVRNRVLQKIEALRKDKRVGKSLECNLKWLVPDHRKGVYESYLAALTEAAIVSKTEIVYVPQKDIEDRLLAAQTVDTETGTTQPSLAGLVEQQFVSQTASPLDISDVEVSVATGTKCNRCWRYTDDTANYGIWQNVCTRCQSALREMGIAPPNSPETAS